MSQLDIVKKTLDRGPQTSWVALARASGQHLAALVAVSGLAPLPSEDEPDTRERVLAWWWGYETSEE